MLRQGRLWYPKAVSFSREGGARAELIRNLQQIQELGRSLALPSRVKMRE